MPISLALALLSLAADGGPQVGHVYARHGSATFTATSVSNADVGLERDGDGNWMGTVGSRTVELQVQPATIASEPGSWVSGRGVLLALVHHGNTWFAKGQILGTPIRIIYPDNQALDGWGSLRFDGLAAEPSPPFLPFVLAIWAAVKGPAVRGGGSISDVAPLELGEEPAPTQAKAKPKAK